MPVRARPGEPVAELVHRENARWVDGARRIGPDEAAERSVLTGDRGPADACCRIVSILR